jgi:glycosyltransferase involved in cell wall biosynthesis
MQEELVSIIIPTYNGEKRISSAIDSVFCQSYKNIEVIIINDGSSDKTLEAIKNLQKIHPEIVVLNNQKNFGFVKSLNFGLEKSKGKYIARIDDDDIWIDNKKLEKQINFLEKNKDYVLCGGGIIIKQEGKKEHIAKYFFPEKDEEIRKSLLSYNLFAHSTVVFKKEVCGKYNEIFGFFTDADMWLKLGTLGKFYNFQEYFAVYADKEDGKQNYLARDIQIRRKLFLRIKMKWHYKKYYPGFLKSLFLCIFGYIYSFLPFKSKIKPFLFSVRKKLGTPYIYSK